jgi:hypothetical protein
LLHDDPVVAAVCLHRDRLEPRARFLRQDGVSR